jgi:hypothetical protein
LPIAHGSPALGLPLPLPPEFPLFPPLPLPLPPAFEPPELPFPLLPLPFPFPVVLGSAGILLDAAVTAPALRTMEPFSTRACWAIRALASVTSICSTCPARTWDMGGISAAVASLPARRFCAWVDAGGVASTSNVPLSAFTTGRSAEGLGGAPAGSPLATGAEPAPPFRTAVRALSKLRRSDTLRGMPSSGPASDGWAASAVTAQAQSSAARRLARVNRPSWIPKRTKALLSPL